MGASLARSIAVLTRSFNPLKRWPSIIHRRSLHRLVMRRPLEHAVGIAIISVLHSLQPLE